MIPLKLESLQGVCNLLNSTVYSDCAGEKIYYYFDLFLDELFLSKEEYCASRMKVYSHISEESEPIQCAVV